MNVALPIFMFLVGFAAGGGIIWLLFRRTLSAAREQGRTSAIADVRIAEERATAKDDVIKQLRNDFSSKDTQLNQRIEENTQLKEQIAKLQTSLSNEEKKTGEKLDFMKDAEGQFIARLSEPVKETLQKLKDEIAVVNDKATNVAEVTSKLVKAFQKPEVRGQWGEMALERALELAGMVEGRDFDRQLTIGEESSKQRPDIVIHLPGGKHLAIDAKAPIDAFLDAVSITEEDKRRTKLQESASQVRKRMKELGSKTYHQHLTDSLEFVLLYLPSEAVYRMALDLDASLIADSYGQRVFLVGPTNLMAVLLVVAEGWKQDNVAKNLLEIRGHAEELYKRLKDFLGHFTAVGQHLGRSAEAYNSAVGSLDTRLMPHARRIEQLGAAPSDIRIKEPATIEDSIRSLQCREFVASDADSEFEDEEALARPR